MTDNAEKLLLHQLYPHAFSVKAISRGWLRKFWRVRWHDAAGLLHEEWLPKTPTPKPKQAVATQTAHAEVGEKAGEVAISGPEGNSRA